jgi:hypothetical protein
MPAPQRDQAVYDSEGGQIIRLNGCSFRPGYPDNLLNLGSTYNDNEVIELTLEREPDNKYDSKAIKVLHKGDFLGYIPAALNAPIQEAMDQGVPYYARVNEVVISKKSPNKPGLIIYVRPNGAPPSEQAVLASALERTFGVETVVRQLVDDALSDIDPDIDSPEHF